MFKDKVLEHDDFAFGEAERGQSVPAWLREATPRESPTARQPPSPAQPRSAPTTRRWIRLKRRWYSRSSRRHATSTWSRQGTAAFRTLNSTPRNCISSRLH
jgi:hypothetical protein